MRWDDIGEEPCSIARALSVVGDRWTLLILRECFLRVRRFEAFEENLGVTRHVLAGRLKKLVEHGVLEKRAYQQSPPRHEYHLTGKGRALYPVLMSLVEWGDTYMAGKKGPPIRHRHKTCGHLMKGRMVCSECGEELDPREVAVEPGPGMPKAERVKRFG